jgi:hypothetical protein
MRAGLGFFVLVFVTLLASGCETPGLDAFEGGRVVISAQGNAITVLVTPPELPATLVDATVTLNAAEPDASVDSGARCRDNQDLCTVADFLFRWDDAGGSPWILRFEEGAASYVINFLDEEVTDCTGFDHVEHVDAPDSPFLCPGGDGDVRTPLEEEEG